MWFRSHYFFWLAVGNETQSRLDVRHEKSQTDHLVELVSFESSSMDPRSKYEGALESCSHYSKLDEKKREYDPGNWPIHCLIP